MAFGYLMDMVLMLFDGIAERIAEKTAERKAIEKQAAEEATEQILKEEAEFDAYIAAKEAEEQALKEEAELAGKEFVETASEKTAYEVIEETALEAEEKVVENVAEISSASKPQIEILIDSQQLGKKWGKHMMDYPNLLSYVEYEEIIIDTFNNPEKIILDLTNGEYYYIKNNNFLRVKLNGEFISMYPGVDSERVVNALNNGGLIWEN